MSACGSILSVMSHAWISIQCATEFHELLALQCAGSQPGMVNHFPSGKRIQALLHRGDNTCRAPGKPCTFGDLMPIQVIFMFLLNISDVWAFLTGVTLASLGRSENAIHLIRS